MRGQGQLPPEPLVGAGLAPTHPSPETLNLLALRRSTPVAALVEPGPNAAELADLLRLALRVPDHRKLEPWRCLTISGPARAELGAVFAAALKASEPDAPAEKLATAAGLPLRAPTLVAVISSPTADPKQTPIWEQELSAGAVCQTLLIAASAMGFAASWITEWPAYHPAVKAALGIAPHERVAGFIYLGAASAPPPERVRPDPALKIKAWRGV